MSTNSRDDYDQKIFRRVGLITILWIIILVAAGLALILFGGGILEMVF